ncbi:MAG TPA: hypothetical protein VFG76_01135, partial [Candidatus Polarisedimenticolia bacterium]|nr:hypothetical protein [Candidatus Polarisedimenticolia bacterium]
LLSLAVFAGVLFLLRRLSGKFHGALGGGPRAQQRRRPSSGGEDLVRDRVCNTFLPRQRAVGLRAGGETLYFCSEDCLAKHRAGLSHGSPHAPAGRVASSARAR